MAGSLILGVQALKVHDCEAKVNAFFERDAADVCYLTYEPVTDSNRLVPEDLAVTLAFNSRATGGAFRSLVENASDVDLGTLPGVALEESSDSDRRIVAELIARVASWKWFSASLATKTLHKKRPSLIPVLDNLAIFEAYMSPTWTPGIETPGYSVRSVEMIRNAIEQITADLVSPQNQLTWDCLHSAAPLLTRVELLDMVWWEHFKPSPAPR